jgi:hypothetical protein
MSRHFTFTEGSRLVRVRCYLHDDTHAAQGWYPNAERVLELSKLAGCGGPCPHLGKGDIRAPDR